MPIYEFFCNDCKKQFEVLCSIKTDLTLMLCSHCQGNKVKKKISGIAQVSCRRSSSNDEGAGSSCKSCSSGSCSTCSH